MTTIWAKPIEGSIFDIQGPQFRVTAVNSRTGEPAEKIIVQKQAPIQPLSLGQERHTQLLGALKNIGAKVSQNVAQIQDVLPRRRDWRA